MNGEPQITITGNLTADPELKFLPGGTPVATFSVASTPRTLDKSSGTWKDGETLYLRCSAWNGTASHVADSLQRGSRVVVLGRLQQRSFQGSDGEKKTVIELTVDDIGPSLRHAIAAVTKVTSGAGTAEGSGDAWAAAPIPVGAV